MSVLRRLLGLESKEAAPDGAAPDTTSEFLRGQCPRCKSPQLLAEQHTLNAARRLDSGRNGEMSYTATQIYCASCGFLINDDVHADGARAYRTLGHPGATGRNLSDDVTETLGMARQLSASTEAEIQVKLDEAGEVFGFVNIAAIRSDGLSDALTRIFRAYFAEGARDVSVHSKAKVLQVDFFTATGFRPVCIARRDDGSFAAFGQAQLYRVLGVRDQAAGTPTRWAP